jgi:hypothetical protein
MTKPTPEKDPNTAEGIDMASLCRTLARVLAHLDEGEYTQEHKQQDTVRQHDVLPDPASVSPTREAR